MEISEESIPMDGVNEHERERLEINRRLLEGCKRMGDVFNALTESCVSAGNEFDRLNRQFRNMKSKNITTDNYGNKNHHKNQRR